MPPKYSTDRQPKAGMSPAAMKPMTPEPRLNPVNIVAIRNDRLLSGTYSEQSVMVTGIAAPRKKPVMMRSVVIELMSVVVPVQMQKTPMPTAAPSSTVRRPK